MAAEYITDKLNQIQTLINDLRGVIPTLNVTIPPSENTIGAISNTGTIKRKCIHIITKKDKKGQQCGASVSAKSTTGNYCTKHIGKEQPTATKKRSVQTKLAIPSQDKKKQSSVSVSSASVLNKNKVVHSIVKNDKGHYVHTPTNFVVDSIDNTKVIGKYTDDGIVALTDRDIILCRSNNFKYEIPVNVKNTCFSQDEIKEPEAVMPQQDLHVPSEFEVDVYADNESDADESD